MVNRSRTNDKKRLKIRKSWYADPNDLHASIYTLVKKERRTFVRLDFDFDGALTAYTPTTDVRARLYTVIYGLSPRRHWPEISCETLHKALETAAFASLR